MPNLMKYERDIEPCQKCRNVEELKVTPTKPKLLKQKKLPTPMKYTKKHLLKNPHFVFFIFSPT